jgi:hypothetical protein
MVFTVLINVITRPFSHVLTLMRISRYVLVQDVSILDRAFRGVLPNKVDREINALKQGGVNSEALFSELFIIYNRCHLSELRELDLSKDDSPVVPTIVCSEAIAHL